MQVKASELPLGRQFLFGKSGATAITLRRWNVVLGLLSVAQAAALLIVSIPYITAPYISFLTKDSLQTQLSSKLVTAVAQRQLASLDIAAFIAGWLCIVGLIHLAAATFLHGRYATALAEGRSGYRWTLYAITIGGLLVTTGLLVGMRDIVAMTSVLGFIVVASWGGARSESQPIRFRRSNQRHVVALLMPVALESMAAWAAVVTYLLASDFFGGLRVSLSAYGLLAIIIASLITLVLSRGAAIQRVGKWANLYYSEIWWAVSLFVASSFCVWLIFASMMHQ